MFLDAREVERGPANTDELVDLPVLFTNITGQPVHVASVSLAGPIPGVQEVGTSLYNSNRVGTMVGVTNGDLSAECPGQFVPHPVSSLEVAPHQFSDWFAMVTIRVTRPGRYSIPRIKISYTTPGGAGWQYWSIALTLIVSNPPLPGPRPIPRDQACPPA